MAPGAIFKVGQAGQQVDFGHLLGRVVVAAVATIGGVILGVTGLAGQQPLAAVIQVERVLS